MRQLVDVHQMDPLDDDDDIIPVTLDEAYLSAHGYRVPPMPTSPSAHGDWRRRVRAAAYALCRQRIHDYDASIEEWYAFLQSPETQLRLGTRSINVRWGARGRRTN